MTRPTRHSCNLDMSTYLCKTKLFQGSYFNRIPQIWNSLPPTIRSSGSLSSFKTALYKHYKSATNSSFDVNNWQGQIQKFQKGGAGSRILERGGRNWTFQCRFPSFSYKSLTNIPPKGGGRGPSSPSPKSAPDCRSWKSDCRKCHSAHSITLPPTCCF